MLKQKQDFCTSTDAAGLARFYAFFEKFGTERLNGLDSSYFQDLTATEKAEAWAYLKDGFEVSDERIRGLYLLDPAAAVELFQQTVQPPVEDSPYPAKRQAAELSRVLMLRCIVAQQPGAESLNELASRATSEFPKVRSAVMQALPTKQLTPEAIDALKSVVFTEVDEIALSTAITKLMAIHGMEFSAKDPTYKSIYVGLSSENVANKKSAMVKLGELGAPEYFA